MSWDDMDAMQDEDFAWPNIPDVIAFRDTVKLVMRELISTRLPSPATNPITMDSPWWGLFLAFEHEKIHLETSSVLMRQLPIDCVEAPPGWRNAPSYATTPSEAPTNLLVSVPAQNVSIGKPRDFPTFGWDNEYGQRSIDVPAFSASNFLVSNAEFLPFVESGCYSERRWWVLPSGDDEGWRWRNYRNAGHPSFWVASSHPDMARFAGGTPTNALQKDDFHPCTGTERAWKLRVEYDIIDMPWDWPCEVNYLEAQAFLAWKAAQPGSDNATFRVLTEAEWHAIRANPRAPAEMGPRVKGVTIPTTFAGEGSRSVKKSSSRGLLADDAAASDCAGADPVAAALDVVLQATVPGNSNWRWHSPTPVNMYGPSSAGFYDTHGNVWEWVEDHFAPLPGFEIHYLYDDFSAPCFDGWHTMIVGGSWVSSGNLASSFARYHFRRHFFQHLGFRYVRIPAPESFPGAATVVNLWEGTALESRDLTAGFTSPTMRAADLQPALTLSTAALSYSTELANVIAQGYVAHTVEGRVSAKAAARVLHLGCGLGAVTFELARSFASVLGVDVRDSAVRHARILQHHGQFAFERVREGVLTSTTLATVSADAAARGRCAFAIGDATDLSAEILAAAPYDSVVLDGLLVRLRQPLDILTKLEALVAPGGLLVISSNNDWSPKTTPRNSWTGGFKMNGEECDTLHMLTYALKKYFILKETKDVIRTTGEHDRRLTIDIMQVSVWQRI
jgi:formylglycine-generating enzyme required for sulfatase activity/2-polyprenyl-3-methyl-5-hydroxy-6-metoxy-1,4-benzoquinol methylase